MNLELYRYNSGKWRGNLCWHFYDNKRTALGINVRWYLEFYRLTRKEKLKNVKIVEN